MKSRRAGRPAVGPAVQVRLPADLLARVQALTDLAEITRPEMIRRLITAGLDTVAWDLAAKLTTCRPLMVGKEKLTALEKLW